MSVTVFQTYILQYSILIFVLLACVCSEPVRYGEYGGLGRLRGDHFNDGPYSEIISDERVGPIDGEYAFSYETSDGSARRETGTPSGPYGAVVKEGEYSVTYPNGRQAHFTYVADENGFRVSSPDIPGLSDHTFAQVDKAQRDRARGIFNDGAYDPSHHLNYDNDDQLYGSTRNLGFRQGFNQGYDRSPFSNRQRFVRPFDFRSRYSPAHNIHFAYPQRFRSNFYTSQPSDAVALSRFQPIRHGVPLRSQLNNVDFQPSLHNRFRSNSLFSHNRHLNRNFGFNRQHISSSNIPIVNGVHDLNRNIGLNRPHISSSNIPIVNGVHDNY